MDWGRKHFKKEDDVFFVGSEVLTGDPIGIGQVTRRRVLPSK